MEGCQLLEPPLYLCHWNVHANMQNLRGGPSSWSGVEMETDRGALQLHNMESGREVLRRAHQGAIIKISGIQGKGGYLSLDTLDNRVEG